MKSNPVHPGGSPKDILRQQKTQEEAVVSKIKSLLQENELNDVFVQHASEMIAVFLKEDATTEEINRVISLLKSNGAKEKENGKLSMDDVEFFVDRDYKAKLMGSGRF